MKHTGFLFLCLFFYGQLYSQNIQIKYAGDPLPDKDRKKIEQFLNYEIEFYAKFGLPDTLSLQLTVFEQREKGFAYLDSIGVHPTMRPNGLYIVNRKEAILLGRENGRERSLAIIYHELSHNLTEQIIGKRPPAWLMEGLAEYFEHCEMGKKGLKHGLTPYEKGRIRTMYMLGEIDIETFVDSDKSKFMKKQRTEEQYAYILAHALVAFWIEKVPEDILANFISSLQNTEDKAPVSVKIGRVYPGSIRQFEQDFAAFCK